MIVKAPTVAIARTVGTAVLNCLATRPAGALLTTPNLVLYTAGPTPGPDTTDLTLFTIANFHGYAAVVVVLTAVGNLGLNDLAVRALGTFTMTSGSPANTENIAGWLLTDGVSAYYAGGAFADPIPFSNVGDFLDLEVILPLKLRPSFAA